MRANDSHKIYDDRDDPSRIACTKGQNELYTEVWRLLPQSYTDVPALLPYAMLPRRARETHIRKLTKPTVQQGGAKMKNWARARPKIKFLKNVPKIFYRWSLTYVTMAKS